ncbi:uncharacterized protein A4U43_C08F26250 [Asparagus officinalis]|uniref:anthocyanidin reductase ((2S)-flavan-3-ol-forming) n=1 Tax=Asparagus officinalis TaxID=4686 RepID=UPI00098E856F|nr:anthocyanidin reductase ((2S)-flavan-3-ol-forming) [Asparagus officinalis]ONK61100.1 uncharacterized protein A4U43_C08F26250 [Asparagus officinalis]
MAEIAKVACVTGGNGFLASTLIKQLLEKGYVVNATVRDPGNKSKVSHLSKLQELGTLRLFQAELTEDGSFDEAVSGCYYVFHVATPVNLFSSDPENELIKPAIQGTLNVLKSCIKSNTVKRVILTSSAATVSASNLQGAGFVLNEESWSDIEFLTTDKPPTWGYLMSKTLAEKEAWKFAEQNKLELVSIIPPLIVGPALNGDIPPSLAIGLSLLTGDDARVGGLKTIQMLSGSISFTHVEDVSRAEIFVAENESAFGRYICCAINTSLPELAEFLSKRYPQYNVPTNFTDVPKKARLSLSSAKLIREGFKFEKKDLGTIYEDSVEYVKTAGLLPN